METTKTDEQASLQRVGRWVAILSDLEAGRIKPTEVIGPGYKNPHKEAKRWLKDSIVREMEAIK